MTFDEACKILKEKDWAAESNQMGNLWAIGPLESPGLKVLGMAPTFTEAVEMALRSENATQESKG